MSRSIIVRYHVNEEEAFQNFETFTYTRGNIQINYKGKNSCLSLPNNKLNRVLQPHRLRADKQVRQTVED